MSKAILVASVIEVPLLALVIFFLPVEVASGITSQTYYSYSALKEYQGAKINMILLGSEVVTIALIPLTAIAITMYRYRVR
jgi:hypothetical protein